MSSILEALKKLEEEKAARRGGSGNIAGKVTASGRRAGRRGAWIVPAGMAAVAVGAVLVTYGLMGGFSKRPSATAPAGKTDSTRTPATSVPRTTTPDVAKDEPDRAAPAGQVQRPATAAPPAAVAAPASALRLPTPKHAASPPEARKAVQPSPPPPAAEQTPAISVTGIAWQQESASRMAVLNGSSVTEGATVAGARVVEILPDRVRFSFKGTDFEVPLK